MAPASSVLPWKCWACHGFSLRPIFWPGSDNPDRIEGFARSVPKEVQGQNGDGDEHARDQKPGIVEALLALESRGPQLTMGSEMPMPKKERPLSPMMAPGMVRVAFTMR